jgi:hypothetical protein
MYRTKGGDRCRLCLTLALLREEEMWMISGVIAAAFGWLCINCCIK